jgi:hypothetical protein
LAISFSIHHASSPQCRKAQVNFTALCLKISIAHNSQESTFRETCHGDPAPASRAKEVATGKEYLI